MNVSMVKLTGDPDCPKHTYRVLLVGHEQKEVERIVSVCANVAPVVDVEILGEDCALLDLNSMVLEEDNPNARM